MPSNSPYTYLPKPALSIQTGSCSQSGSSSSSRYSQSQYAPGYSNHYPQSQYAYASQTYSHPQPLHGSRASNTNYHSNGPYGGQAIIRDSSHSSNGSRDSIDSGYVTYSPSVASPQPQSHISQGYSPNTQLLPPPIEVSYTVAPSRTREQKPR